MLLTHIEYIKRFTKYAKKVLIIKLTEFIQKIKFIFLVSNAKHHNVVKRIKIKKQNDITDM
jgi:hypothetical protein